jgi:anti-sigma factor RsiW
MNTTHPVAREEVMAFLDGELSAAEAQAISAHLNHCVECTGVVEQFRDTSQSLSRWSVPLFQQSWSIRFEIWPTKLALASKPASRASSCTSASGLGSTGFFSSGLRP